MKKKQAEVRAIDAPVPYSERPYFELTRNDYVAPLGFMVSMMLLGLSFYPALAAVLVMIIYALRNDRYNFAIMVTLFAGGFGFIDGLLPVKNYDIVLFISAVLIIIFRKPPIVNRAVLIMVAYIAVMFILAAFSLESMSIQFLIMRNYWCMVFFIIPIVAFSGHEFSIHELFRKLMPFVIVISVFYLLDSLLIHGNFFVPRTHSWFSADASTLWSPAIDPLAVGMMRKYPPGMYLVALVLLPLARFYKLHPWQWIVIGLAVLSTQTFSVISGFIVAFIIFQGKIRLLFKIGFGAIAGLALLYVVDSLLPMHNKDAVPQSTLRLKSSIDQILDLRSAVDDADLAEFASGRIAQALPKLELVASNHRQLTGLGFLHPEKSKISGYIITNEYYSDVTEAEEMAATVEIEPVQVYINMGWIGLLAHILFFVALYWLVRRLRYRAYFVSVLFVCFWLGLAGFCGLHNIHGLSLSALAYATVILENRDKLSGFRRSLRKGLRIPH